MGLLRHCLAEIRRRTPEWSTADELLLDVAPAAARDAARQNPPAHNAVAQAVFAVQRPAHGRAARREQAA
jgi:hypothetical protein